MQTLTIRVPDTVYHAALTFTPAERERLFAVAITVAHAALEEEPDYDRPTDEADLEAIGRGLQAAAEGRTTPGDIVFARLREQARNGHIPK